MSKVDNYIVVFYSKGQSLTVLPFSCFKFNVDRNIVSMNDMKLVYTKTNVEQH